MKNLQMFCLTLDNNHLKKIKKLEYIPVGLGESNFSEGWFTDKSGNDIIAHKNPYYGEYTFHYWIWKNYLKEIKTNWVGFCQYRKFWSINKIDEEKITLEKLNSKIIKKIPVHLYEYDSFIGEPFYVNQFRFMKFIKRNFKKMLFNPSLLLDENKRTIKFHFDMWHGEGNLEKAIKLLDPEERNDFKEFTETNTFFNPHNMFICKPHILLQYYDSIFPWLNRCEKVFGFENLKGFGLKRIYGFLAERYLSYWFKKYTIYKTLPIYFKDITNL
jgi:hypothetical protein|tara:strand:- start:10051 stop:10866 length:816 start_codon:yes stop_codon:yes gene_type:complete